MPLITDYLRDAIWMEGEPRAAEAFEQIARDHGRGFAEAYRDAIMNTKLVDWQEAVILGHCPPDTPMEKYRAPGR